MFKVRKDAMEFWNMRHADWYNKEAMREECCELNTGEWKYCQPEEIKEFRWHTANTDELLCQLSDTDFEA